MTIQLQSRDALQRVERGVFLQQGQWEHTDTWVLVPADHQPAPSHNAFCLSLPRPHFITHTRAWWNFNSQCLRITSARSWMAVIELDKLRCWSVLAFTNYIFGCYLPDATRAASTFIPATCHCSMNLRSSGLPTVLHQLLLFLWPQLWCSTVQGRACINK